MKNLLTAAVFSILATAAAWAQDAASKKIVFDITSADPKVQETAIRHVGLMADAYPGIQLELVVYGGALPMYMKEKSTVGEKIAELAKNKNITFAACQGKTPIPTAVNNASNPNNSGRRRASVCCNNHAPASAHAGSSGNR